MKLLKHQGLTAAGCLLWCISFFSEGAGLQPYSTVGLAISPVLLVVGIFYWTQHYYKTKEHYPRISPSVSDLIGGMTKNHFLSISFLFRHVLQFWTISILFWMIISFSGFSLFTYSDAFKATQQYCRTNSKTLSMTGRIKYYSPLISGSIEMHNDAGRAELFFTIIGTKGNFDGESRLIKQDGNWTVQELKMKE